MNINDAITKVTESNPDEANVINDFISGMKSKNVVTLGTNEVFTLTDKGGDIKAFKQRVLLSAHDKTLIQPTYNGPYVISALGYEVLSEHTGACVIFPDTVTVGNQQLANPYAERSKEDNRIIAVHARAVAFRFSSKGIPQVSDWTTIFDTQQYRLIDLLAKAKRRPHAFKLLPKGTSPTDLDKKDNGTWAKYSFDSSSDLYINTSHDEALTWFSQIINREKKAIDFAQTFAKRNAIKHLIGLQAVPGQTDNNGNNMPIPEWNLEVICWRPTNNSPVKWDTTQYKMLQKNVGGIIAGKTDDFSDKRIELKSGTEHIEENENTANIDPEDQVQAIDIKKTKPYEVTETKPKPKKKVEEKPDPVYTAAEQKIINNYETAKKSLPDYFKQALKELKCVDSPDPKQAKRIMQKINEIIDKENA